ncbi:MAG TPA: hypothetical protein DEQ55_05805 [Pseudomonas sp.]|nr:hypothetical protein [Pseudomonas sp.]
MAVARPMSETIMVTARQKMAGIIMVVLAPTTTVLPALWTIPIVVHMPKEIQRSKAEPITTPPEVRVTITLRRLRRRATLTQMANNMCMRIDSVLTAAVFSLMRRDEF